MTSASDHDYGKHYESEGDYHWQVCKECGYESEKETHTVVDEDYLSSENHHWHLCTKCGKVVRYHYHAWEYMYDGDKHWQECRCGFKKNKTDHSFNESGKCTVCGYVNATPNKEEEGEEEETVDGGGT